MEKFYCNTCGWPYSIDGNGIATHCDEGDGIDHDRDADHVPFGFDPWDEPTFEQDGEEP